MTVVYPRSDQSSAGGLDDLDGLLCVQQRLKVLRYSFLETIPNFFNWLLRSLLLVGSM